MNKKILLLLLLMPLLARAMESQDGDGIEKKRPRIPTTPERLKGASPQTRGAAKRLKRTSERGLDEIPDLTPQRGIGRCHGEVRRHKRDGSLCFSPHADACLKLARALYAQAQEKEHDFDEALASLSLGSSEDGRLYTTQDLAQMAAQVRDMFLHASFVGLKESEIPIDSFTFHQKVSSFDRKPRQEIMRFEREVRSRVPELRHPELSRLVELGHIVDGSNGGGGHVWPELEIQRRALFLQTSLQEFEPITNRSNGVSVFHRMNINEPKTIFSKEVTAEEVFDTARNIALDQNPYAQNLAYFTHDQDRCRGVLNKVAEGLAVEIIDESLVPDGFGSIRSCYPIFSFIQWQADQPEICLADVEFYGAESGSRRLCLSSDRIIELATEAREGFLAGAIADNPVRYERDETYIVDLAPILKKKHEDGTLTFWRHFPQSIVPKGIYVEIPKTELDGI
ncbi:TPA: hypothetical protein DIC20_05125 [Candidatus Dependentiae bacterium]|nr:MAG: hypothetical protein US13_C0016G0017 [candidate division TM6 bacterium GW2011_GWE2_36_25]HBR70165.1 hypothetical protein [Candidatus Dependentiae bacterium]HCU01053.1 hypothetical protein [Candidatus Dependentiae bacterium]